LDWSYNYDVFRINSYYKKMRKIFLIIPIFTLITISLFFLLFIVLEKNPNVPPSALLNKDLPSFSSVNLYKNDEILIPEKIKGKYVLINFFASWCTPCRAEHHLFFKIKEEIPDLFILGFSHKDDPNESKNYLKEEGNPYSFVGLDKDGRIGFEFGVFGLPETFFVNKKGQIIFKHTGPLTENIIKDEIKKFF